MNLFVFGLGYSAGHFVRTRAGDFERISGTVRSPEKRDAWVRQGIDAFTFDGPDADPKILPALAEADAVLVSVQPKGERDAALDVFGDRIAESRAGRLLYLSTIGVYGDHGGDWIDETTPPHPESARGRQRLLVEDAWLELGRRAGKSVSILRLAGIYGSGRNVLEDLRAGEARRIDKPGQVFNRIHVEDIGRTIGAALARDAGGVWNVADDEPAPAPDVVAYGAALLGVEPPPLTPFAEADLSPMARSFYGANRRVSNRAIKDRLGVTLAYPTYRQGLDALVGQVDP